MAIRIQPLAATVRRPREPALTVPVLVTGGTGFIGAAVIRRMQDRGGFDVRASVRAGSARQPDGVRIEQVDLGRDSDWTAAVRGVQVVVHCAARVHVMRETAADPLADFRRANVEGTLALARQAAQAGVRRFVFLSTVKVLGESSPPGRPLQPDDPLAPQDAYAVSKLEAEEGLRELAAGTGMEVVILRPPLVYGPGVKGNFASLVRWIRRGRPLPLGAASNRRSLVALDNLSDFIVLCADRDRSALAANQAFLVSDGTDVTTADLVRRIAHAYGSKTRLLPVPPSWMAAMAGLVGKRAAADRLLGWLQVDSSRCQSVGWTPVTSMDDQLRRMAASDASA